MKRSIRNKKGMELSINMLVIVALAIFSLFLLVGFVLGGFSYFKGIFGSVSTQPSEVAKVKCQSDLLSARNIYRGNPVPATSKAFEQLCDERFDVDFNNNGLTGVNPDGTAKDPGESYECSSYVDTTGLCK